LDPGRVERLLGLKLTDDRIEDILVSLGFRRDARRYLDRRRAELAARCDQEADLIEEIARIAGYDNLPTTAFGRPAGERFEAPATVMQNRVRAARRAAALAGYDEAISWSFCRHDEAALFGGVGEGLKLANPISSELDVMRPARWSTCSNPSSAAPIAALRMPAISKPGRSISMMRRTGQRTVVAGARRVIVGPRLARGEAPDVFDIKADLGGHPGRRRGAGQSSDHRRCARLVASGPLGRSAPGQDCHRRIRRDSSARLKGAGY
jgi:phenylalanyl-tRNA synthetase beta chain